MKYAYKVVGVPAMNDEYWISCMSYYLPDKFIIRYKIGIVNSPEKTPGIFCFRTKKIAIEYAERGCNNLLKILKVKPLSRGRVPKIEELLYFKNLLEGTICFKKIEVLNEVKF